MNLILRELYITVGDYKLIVGAQRTGCDSLMWSPLTYPCKNGSIGGNCEPYYCLYNILLKTRMSMMISLIVNQNYFKYCCTDTMHMLRSQETCKIKYITHLKSFPELLIKPVIIWRIMVATGIPGCSNDHQNCNLTVVEFFVTSHRKCDS